MSNLNFAMGSHIAQLVERSAKQMRPRFESGCVLLTKKLINMVNIYKRYIKRQVLKATLPLGIDITMRCADFVTSAPIWQWKKRLWVVTHAVGFLPKERLEVGMENLVLFLDE